MPKRFPALIVSLLLSALLLPLSANAAGFAIYEWGARGQALSGTLVGRADDPSALAYNPAGMTQLEGIHTMAGVTAIAPSTKVTLTGGVAGPNPVTTKTEDNIFLPPHAFLTWQLNDHYWLGLGIFSRFGLGNEYDPAWPGRYQVYDVALETLSVNPNLAIKLTDKLSGSIGLEGMWMSLAQKNKIPTMSIRRPISISSWRPTASGMASTWASTTVPSTGSGSAPATAAKFARTPMATPSSALQQDRYSMTTDISGTIILPATFMVGAAVYPTDRLSIEANVMLMQWSSYESLDITFARAVGSRLPLSDQCHPQELEGRLRYQIGLEYKATDWLDLRIGYIFDEDPIDPGFADFLLPTNDRHFLNLGAGFHRGAWNVDVAYTYMHVTERDNPTVNTGALPPFTAVRFHDGNAHKVGLSVGYAF
jgi:long-chain fatty acid transport protein